VSARDQIFEAWLAEARNADLLSTAAQCGAKLRRQGAEWIGPCPSCGGVDRFSINAAKRVWNCRGACGGNDAISLTMHVASVGFIEALEMLVGARESSCRRLDRTGTGTVETSRRREVADTERDLASARRITAGLEPVVGTPGERYLAKVRHIDVSTIRDVLKRTDAIGWHSAVYFNEPGHELHGQHLGCIVGIMTDAVTAQPTGAISRTYIDANLRKIGKAKTLGSPRGVIRLSRDEDVHEGLHIAEGIETALTAMAHFWLRPTWTTGDTGTMRNFPVLAGIEALTIFADHDRNSAGENAARELAGRWVGAGREVHIRRWSNFGDLNDAIKKRLA
jgi:hypothetical protein